MSDAGRAIDDLIVKLQAASLKAVDYGAEQVSEVAKVNAFVFMKKPTGRLSDSIRTTGPYPSEGGFEALVGPTVVYGRLRELGGVIAPLGHPYLAFSGYSYDPGHNWLWGEFTHTPLVVQKGTPYLKPAVEAVQQRFYDKAVDLWSAAIETLNG